MLGKIATAGHNGQFRTPRHEIQLMVELVKPRPTDVMCDPASGTCRFPVAVGEYLHENHSETFTYNKVKKHFHEKVLNAFDFDSTMLRIGSMNMRMHTRIDAVSIARKQLEREAHIVNDSLIFNATPGPLTVRTIEA